MLALEAVGIGGLVRLAQCGIDDHFLLVGNGGYATIQAAVNAAVAGDTILVAPGTYGEHVDLNKAVTLARTNFGLDGNSARGAESGTPKLCLGLAHCAPLVERLIGGLYVSAQFNQAAIARRLLEEMLYGMRTLPNLSRIEAQLMPFGGPVDNPLRELGFRLYTRQFMLLDLSKPLEMPPGATTGLRISRWHDRYFDPCAKLIFLAYADHIDGDINDQYRSKSGALRFLKNIILLPGCGQFVPGASFVLHMPGSDELLGAVLTSEVSPGVGHTTQLCVIPGHQGHGLGRALMITAVHALRGLKFHELTLTVTSVNHTAVQLYEKLGFKTLKSFTAGVWPR